MAAPTDPVLRAANDALTQAKYANRPPYKMIAPPPLEALERLRDVVNAALEAARERAE